MMLPGRFSVDGFPAIKLLLPGKNGRQTYSFDGSRTPRDIIEWVIDMLQAEALSRIGQEASSKRAGKSEAAFGLHTSLMCCVHVSIMLGQTAQAFIRPPARQEIERGLMVCVQMSSKVAEPAAATADGRTNSMRAPAAAEPVAGLAVGAAAALVNSTGIQVGR
jgi:hypothetical protein